MTLNGFAGSKREAETPLPEMGQGIPSREVIPKLHSQSQPAIEPVGGTAAKVDAIHDVAAKKNRPSSSDEGHHLVRCARAAELIESIDRADRNSPAWRGGGKDVPDLGAGTETSVQQAFPAHAEVKDSVGAASGGSTPGSKKDISLSLAFLTCVVSCPGKRAREQGAPDTRD